MAHIFGLDVDFNYNETKKQRLSNLLSFPTLSTAEKGFVFFHTANNKFYGWTGTAWLDFSLAGGGGGVTSFNTRTGPVVPAAGDYDAFYYTEAEVDSFLSGKANTSHTHLLSAGATDVTATAAELNLLDLSGLTAGWVLSADSATTASWKAPSAAGDVFLAASNVFTGSNTFNNDTFFNSVIYLDRGDTGSASGDHVRITGSTDGDAIWVFNSGGFRGALNFQNLTTNRGYLLPDATGTIALTNDLSGFVDLTTTQTITGAKTFSNNLTINANLAVNAGTYEFDLFPSGLFIANTGQVSPNNGAFGFSYFSNRWTIAAPNGNTGQSGVKMEFQNNNPATTPLSTSVRVLGQLTVDDEVYGASWNGSTQVPTKNAVYDKIQTLAAGGGDVFLGANNVFTGSNTFTTTTNFEGTLLLRARPSDDRAVILGWNASTVDWFGINHGSQSILWVKDNKLKYKKASTVNNGFAIDFTNTLERTYTFPNKDGTVAMLDDITGGGATISDAGYGAAWNGNTTDGASKNAIYDQIETLVTLSTSQELSGNKTLAGGFTFLKGNPSSSFVPALVWNENGKVNRFNQSTVAGNDLEMWVFNQEFCMRKSSQAINQGMVITQANTAVRTYTFPDKSGTVAMLSDITGGTISDIAYAASWNGNLDGASKNAIYDKIETLVTLGTFQTITGAKIFDVETNHNGGIVVGDGVTTSPTGNRVQFTNTVSPGALQSSSYAGIGMNNNDIYWHQAGANSEWFTKLATSNTAARTHTLPDKSGTVAHTSDIPTRTTGSFSPTLKGSISGTYTHSSNTGNWVRFGKVVHFSILFNTPTGTAPTGNLVVAGLPWDFGGNLVNGSVTLSGVTSPSNPLDMNIKGAGVTGEINILYNNGFDNTTPMGEVNFDGSGQLSIVGSFIDV